MGISFATKIVAVIVKSAVNSKISGELGKELIGTLIDGVSEKSILEINYFVNGKKSKIKNALSDENLKLGGVRENIIEFVREELKVFLQNVGDIDKLLMDSRYDEQKLNGLLWKDYCGTKDYVENESDMKIGIFSIAKVLLALESESEEFGKLLIHISESVDDIKKEVEKLSAYMQKNYGSKNEEIQMILAIVQMILEQFQNKDSEENDIRRQEKFKNNKKKAYIKNWNSSLFLHQDNHEKPITLAGAFIMPDYEMIDSVNRIGFSDDDTLEEVLEKFIQYTRTSTMLIAGVPGMGKTTITSWIANEYETDDNVIILRFCDWERKELKQGLLKAIYETLKCKKKDLENRVLILDGFDEVKALDIRNSVLSEYVNELKDFENLKCIITSRPAYIDAHYFQNVIKLHEFDIGKVEEFYKNITGDILYNKGKIASNLEVLGIPVILYMAIMSDVDISENPSKPELYNRIFAEKGGIFDKFFDGETQYGFGEQIMRKPENIRKYLEFLSDTAFRMFEKDELQLEKNECKDIKLEFKKKGVSILEFPIKHLFEDAETNIEFVHKSIYEYFVSEYIFWGIENTIERNNSKEELACVLGGRLKMNSLSDEILEFLEYKIVNEMNDVFDTVKEAFELMLQDGMTYYTNKCYKNIIECEINVYSNMLKIVNLCEIGISNVDSKKIMQYIQYCNSKFELSRFDLTKINLSEMRLEEGEFRDANLKKANFWKADLKKINFKDANLYYANFGEANLKMVDFTGADLRKVNFINAKFIGVNLEGADLRGAVFDEKQVSKGYICGLKNQKYDLTETKIYISGTEIITYSEFENRQ